MLKNGFTSPNTKYWKNLVKYFSLEVITLLSFGNQALLGESIKFINIKNKHKNKQQC